MPRTFRKAEIDILAEEGREPAQERAGSKDEQAQQQDAPPPVNIGDAPHQRHGDDEAQQVRADDPGGMIEMHERNVDARIGDDLGQHRHYHRLVERGKKDCCAGHDHRQHRRAASARASGVLTRRRERLKRTGNLLWREQPGKRSCLR